MANEFKVKKGLIVQGSGSAILDIQGDLGQLFSITDSLTGDLFTVSDISGIPLIKATADLVQSSVTIYGTGHNNSTGPFVQGCLVIDQNGNNARMFIDGNDIDVTSSNDILYLQDYSKGLVQMGGSAAVAGTMNIGPNVSSRYLNLGTSNQSTTTTANIGVSNGNLHIDAAQGAYTTYINFYDGTEGVVFGNGAGASSGASVSSAGVITAPTFAGALSGNATTATNLASISTTFSGTYPMTVNVGGTIYSHTGVTYNGTTGALTATSFIGSVTGTASSVTVTNSTSATWYPVVWHNNSNSLFDTVGKLEFQASTGTIVSTIVKTGTSSTGCEMVYNSTDNSLDFIFT